MLKKELSKAAALALFATAASVGLANAEVATKWKGSPETSEEDRSFHVNGRFMYDVAFTDADYATPAGAAFESGLRSYARRAFLGVDGKLTANWRYNAKFDFSFGSPGNIKADDFYLEYAGSSYSLFFGNANAVSPMEDRDSSLNIPFNERSLMITAGGFGKKPGISYLTNGGNWSWGVGLQSNDGLDSSDSAKNGSESGFLISRLTYAPIFQQTPDGVTLLHLGLTGRYRDIGSGTGKFSYNPGQLSTKVSNSDLGTAAGGFGQDTYVGGEVAFQMNSFGAEAEYGHFDTGRGVSASADGYYVDVFWSPTGESRAYKASDGSFNAVKPFRTLGSDGGIGHVMLSARYENMDLTDTAFTGNENEQTAYTVGATWVPINNVKFQLNYSDTDIDYVSGALLDNNIKAVTLRTQLDW